MEGATLVNLPPELERDIFELAAWEYPEAVKTLILVARRVCIWIEPQLYQVVLSRGSGATERLLQMMHSKPPEFLREHVCHLALSSLTPRSDVTRILSTCTNVHDLAIWTGDTYPELLSDMRHLTNLRRLSINLFDLFGGHNGFQLPRPEELLPLPFAHLTHLDVFSSMPEPMWPVFGMFPCLTHLAFSDYYHPEMVHTTLDTCAVLQLLVIVWTYDDDPDAGGEDNHDTSEISDPRFCTIPCHLFESDWEEGAWGGLDFWRRAEIELRERGERRQGSVSEESQPLHAQESQ
ncbi:hypothetical protein MVEN_02219800 [Mycena venus]|uniref:Uncharacterized protein n=1 Tax=Mycena venus TaxID=2733690 RepID=A0A8H7CFE3_9AGAR|nr:hypothetical protein MVEN_02219800 [Mycena venus]